MYLKNLEEKKYLFTEMLLMSMKPAICDGGIPSCKSYDKLKCKLGMRPTTRANMVFFFLSILAAFMAQCSCKPEKRNKLLSNSSKEQTIIIS